VVLQFQWVWSFGGHGGGGLAVVVAAAVFVAAWKKQHYRCHRLLRHLHHRRTLSLPSFASLPHLPRPLLLVGGNCMVSPAGMSGDGCGLFCK